MKAMFFRLLLVFWAGYFINPAISSFPYLGRFGEIFPGAISALVFFSVSFLLVMGLKRLLIEKGADYAPITERYETFCGIIVLGISIILVLLAMAYFSESIKSIN